MHISLKGEDYEKMILPVIMVAVLYMVLAANALAATPGLPFTEDFSDIDLRDDNPTNADWNTDEQAVYLAWEERHYNSFGSDITGSDITSDAHYTYSVALGDVDGDGDLDLVAGNYMQANRACISIVEELTRLPGRPAAISPPMRIIHGQ